jgi:MFS transporter, AAHS family, 4-hydroxybenzoate transporter
MASVASGEGQLTRARLVLVVVLCSVAYVLDGISQVMLGPLAPGIAKTLSLSRAELGPVFSASLAGQSVGLMLISMLPSRFGYRPVLAACVVGYGLLEIVTALVTTRDHLIALRFLTGIGIGGSLPICLALVSEHAAGRRRGAAVMTLAFAYGVGGFLAGLVAAQFQEGESWRHAFALIGALSAVIGVFCWFWVEESPSYLASRSTELPTKEKTPAPSAAPWRLFSPGMLLGTLMMWLIFIACLAVQNSLFSWLSTLLVGMGRNPEFAALSVSALSLGGLIAMPIIGVLVDRFGSVKVLSAFFMASVPLLILLGAKLGSASETELLILAALAGFALLGGYGGANVILSEYYPPHLRSIGIGWTKSASRIGTIMAPIMVGLALAWGVTEQNIIIILAFPPLLVVAALLVSGVVMRRRALAAAAVGPA